MMEIMNVHGEMVNIITSSKSASGVAIADVINGYRGALLQIYAQVVGGKSDDTTMLKDIITALDDMNPTAPESPTSVPPVPDKPNLGYAVIMSPSAVGIYQDYLDNGWSNQELVDQGHATWAEGCEPVTTLMISLCDQDCEATLIDGKWTLPVGSGISPTLLSIAKMTGIDHIDVELPIDIIDPLFSWCKARLANIESLHKYQQRGRDANHTLMVMGYTDVDLNKHATVNAMEIIETLRANQRPVVNAELIGRLEDDEAQLFKFLEKHGASINPHQHAGACAITFIEQFLRELKQYDELKKSINDMPPGTVEVLPLNINGGIVDSYERVLKAINNIAGSTPADAIYGAQNFIEAMYDGDASVCPMCNHEY